MLYLTYIFKLTVTITKHFLSEILSLILIKLFFILLRILAISFFKSLKTELIYGSKLISKEQMKLEIFEYIEIWYNRKRRHSALNYKNIEEFNVQINYKNVA
jgi:transposase InsO family protein